MGLLDDIIRLLFGRDNRSKEKYVSEKRAQVSGKTAQVSEKKTYLSETDQFEDNFKKGYEFEKYVVELFNEDYFNVNTWTTDGSGKHDGKWVESNFNPDLIMRYVPRDEKFAIECKYRSNLEDGNLRWSYQDQIDRYNQFERENSINTFIVIGLGGDPSNPGRMFCIPLRDAKYSVLYPGTFEKFERPPARRFFWKDGILR